MELEKLLGEHQVFIFELDDVLYPKKDYLLQVYYLFAQFIEHTEQLSASEILNFMKDAYINNGDVDIFLKTASYFNLPEKYQYNFELLHENVRLPLKLLLFAPVLDFMKRVVGERKRILLLTDGNPIEQLNKIKQVEWNGMETHVIVYFTKEITAHGKIEAVQIIADKHTLSLNQIVMISRNGEEEVAFSRAGIKLLSVDRLLSC